MEKKFFTLGSFDKLTDIGKGIFFLSLRLSKDIKDVGDIAGRFFMLRKASGAVLLGRPISVYHAEKEKIHFLIADKGIGTKELHNLKAGDEVELLGPLGNGFSTFLDEGDEGEKKDKKERRICLVSGGIGVAPVAAFAHLLEEKGIHFDFYASFKSAPYGFDYIKTKPIIATEDGSAGARGMLPVILPADFIKKYDAVFTCGPNPMIDYLKGVVKDSKVKCYASLERRMACGVGVCLGCNVLTKDGVKRCCADGPVFDVSTLIDENKEKAPVKKTPPVIMKKDAQQNDVDLSVHIRCKKSGEVVTFKNPIVASSGTFGFATEYKDIIDIERLGGVSSKGLTLEAREGNGGVRLWETPSGLLNSIGLQNPGIPYFIDNLLSKMLALKTVTIVNLSGSTAEDYIEGAKLLNKTDAKVIELNISCPNVKTGGAAFGMKCDTAKSIVSEIRNVTDKLLVVKLTPQAKDLTGVALAAIEAGADAISLCNSFSGMAIDIEKGRPVFDRVTAGFGGPAVRPIALRLVYETAKAIAALPKDARVPIFSIGGVASYRDAIEFIMAGAAIVEVGTATFGSPHSMESCIEGLESFMKRKGYNSLDEIRGIAL